MSTRNRLHDDGSLADLEREVLGAGDESAREYLRRRWLASAIGEVRRSRIRGRLTQADVAERMKTTQSAVARLERDHEGRLTLRRFIDYALACGVIPLELQVLPFEDVQRFAASSPDVPLTAMAYGAWCASQEARTAAATSLSLPTSWSEASPYGDYGGLSVTLGPALGTRPQRRREDEEESSAGLAAAA